MAIGARHASSEIAAAIGRVLVVFVATLIPGPADADAILLPAQGVDGNAVVPVIYRLETPAAGKAILDLEWTDALGRIVERRQIIAQLDHSRDISFTLDTRRAVALGNHLHTVLTLTGESGGAPSAQRPTIIDLPFIVRPANDAWSDYQVIKWQPSSLAQAAALKKLEVTAGMVLGHDSAAGAPDLKTQIAPLLGNDLRWYVENIATDFYSSYHRWQEGRPVNLLFQEAKRRYWENPGDRDVLKREPSLSDPLWLAQIRDRLLRVVRSQRRYRPLYYSLADEPGTAELSVMWDFDFSAPSLAGFRQWLRGQYGSLTALNRQWGSHFRRWDDVMPMTTAEAISGVTDDNFSAWADFKAWMDVAFSRALAVGAHAVHEADPTAHAAIEGGQVPGWGGYDYSRLVKAVDAIELYDGGGNMEITRSLNPGMVILTTSSGSGPAAVHEIWREFLRGARGTILWDPKGDLVRDDGSVSDRGRDLAGPLRDLRSGLGALLVNSPRATAPIAILYSPASLRTQWMLDWQPWGDAWSRRASDADYEDASAVRSSMGGFLRLFEHLGIAPQVVTRERLEAGDLEKSGLRLLVLPRAIALSPGEAAAIRRFLGTGGTVIADGEPGLFDQHSRRFKKPPLADLFRSAGDASSPRMASRGGRIRYLDPLRGARADDGGCGFGLPAFDDMAEFLEQARLAPTVTLRNAAGKRAADSEISVFRQDSATIVALLPDPICTGDALARDGERVTLTLDHVQHAHDLIARADLGRTDHVELTLDPAAPAMMAISDRRIFPVGVAAPAKIRLGETAELKFASTRPMSVLHIDIVDPAGRLVAAYSGNLRFRGGQGRKDIPFALNDPAGSWEIRVRDILTGDITTRRIRVLPP